MDELRIDTSDVGKLAAQIDQAVTILPREIRPVVQKGALNIKQDAKKRIGYGGHAGQYAATIGYESEETRTGAWAEIGPDKEKQVGGGKHRTPGNLGTLLEYEYGTPWSAPKPHLGPALEAEAPKFEKALEAVMLKALGL
ncbi:hypothetical protein [Actinoplanes siamensis]|uniref:HK97 gp10 family phage protein n=1 Tax=Actinoplanes siamensis TaxID=1223317 RepID=A0A919NDB8_9ACTN|nr:hypothetical protein [Actinoplanes siamensis]GIF08660.1 hypothetical protein Asi03nite_61980 [Actinoplanes siamensis]